MRITWRTSHVGDRTTVETPPVLRPLWRGFRWGVGGFFLACAILAAVGGDWGPAVVCLLVGAVVVPRRKQARDMGRAP